MEAIDVVEDQCQRDDDNEQGHSLRRTST
jgi:hypothetical protein